MTNVDQKIALQEAGLGVGWLPRYRIRHQLAEGTLVEKKVDAPREPIPVHIARRNEEQGKASAWFWERLSQPELYRDWLDIE